MKDIIFTTLLYLLYPPLKGFSHSLDSHVYVNLRLFLQLLQGVLKQIAFEGKVTIVELNHSL